MRRGAPRGTHLPQHRAQPSARDLPRRFRTRQPAAYDMNDLRHALSLYTANRTLFMNHTDRIFLDFSVRKLELLTERIETCLDRLNADQIWARGGENENAVGNLAMHLAGNVRQWIVSSIGGTPDVRQRDAEFATRSGLSVAELKERLRAAVTEGTAVIKGVTSERL